MVDHGLTMVKLSFHGQLKVMLFWVDHGQIDGQFKVMFSGLTMVKLMVISWSVEGHVVPGRPWSDQGHVVLG